MPADRRTPFPEHVGEAKLAKRLVPMLGEDVHLWFSVCLPGAKEIDLLLWHEEVGVFAIEVKAVPLDMFESFNLTRCHIGDRKPGRSPHGQAQEASLDLRNYLNARKVRPPFIVATSAFPLISRSAWDNHWDSDAITGDFSQRILFREDFEAGPTALRNRLDQIYRNPPSGAGSNQQFSHKANQFTAFDRAIAPPDATPRPTPSDLDRLKIIESTVAKDWIERVPVFGGAHIGFTGRPGTGKTFRLLQIGANHSSQKAEVLYLCFNKVLAADIRRLLQWGRTTGSAAGCFDVYDVHQLRRLRLEERGLENSANEDDLDARCNEAVELLEIDRDEIATYDTVLLDEAQDLTDWMVRLAELHLKDGGTFAIGVGTGQELYNRGTSERLTTVMQDAEEFRLRRNFRNTKETFQAAFVAYESKLQRTGIKSAAEKFRTDITERTQGVLFERKEGRFPILEPVPTESLKTEDRSSPFFADMEQELLANKYAELIADQLQQLDGEGHPIDLLILVPKEESVEATAAREALRSINQEFFDLTQEDSRRAVVPSTAVRLCTFHSSRGVEGHRVLILGFARLLKLCESMAIPPEQLAYIVLSRSVFETVIAVRSEEWNWELIVFMQEVLPHLQSR